MKISRISILILVIVFLSSLLPMGSGLLAGTVTFAGNELLGKPTDTSITINIVPNADIEYYYEYGTSSGSYGPPTPTLLATAGEPHEVVGTVLWLASDASKFVTGTVIPIDGGFSIY